MKIIMIPFAGGSASSYELIAKNIETKSDLSCSLYEYPGHGSRIIENLTNNVEEIIKDCCEFINKTNYDNDDLIIFGHSLGALIAFEVTNHLILNGINIRALIVSGMAPPNLKESGKHHFVSNESFLKSISTLGGIPPEIINDKEALEFFGEIMKNDYELYDNLSKEFRTIEVPIIAFWGEKDDNFSGSIVGEWENITNSDFQLRKYSGNHFFILENVYEVSHEIIEFARRLKDKQKTIIGIFKDQVSNTPNNIAVITENEQYTYKQIDLMSNEIAKRLLENNVKIGDFVPIVMQRSEHLICSILGILKVGAVYVPVAPEFPATRKKFILKDISAKLVVVDAINSLKDYNVMSLCIDALSYENVNHSSITIPKLNGNSTLYCIYTSGTTGNPKGVPNTNVGCINRISWMQAEYPISYKDRILQKTNYVFDVSVWEIFGWFFVGATCVLLEDGKQGDPAKIYETIVSKEITTLHFVPTMLAMYMSYLEENKIHDSSELKWIFSSGEALRPDYAARFYECSNGTLVNMYGPTEASIDVTHYKVTGKEKKMPIGKPITNMQVIVVNPESFEVCPDNEEGEILISGIGLSKGYLNSPKKTNQVFIPNPFGEGICYKTGDYGYTEKGLIYYTGRKDNQIKINGYRIELDEISFQLNNISGIEDSRILVNKRNDNIFLQAYYISGNIIKDDEIRKELANNLPKYMIPHEYYHVENFPITINGKLDNKALLDISNKINETEFKSNELNRKEKIVYNCIKDSLGKKNVDLQKSFISLGGDSIMAIRLLSRLRDNRLNCSIKDILTSNTIYGICQLVQLENRDFKEQFSRFGLIEDTPIIKLFRNYDLIKPGHFNQIRSKNENDLNVEHICSVFDRLVEIHPELNAKFTDSFDLLVEEKEFSNVKVFMRESLIELDWEQELLELFNKNELNFDVFEPLLKVVIYKMKNSIKLILIAHHLIIDEISWKNIFKDYDHLKRDIILGVETKVSKFGKTSFRSWSYLLNEYKENFKFSEESSLWRERHRTFQLINEKLNANFAEDSKKIVSISKSLLSQNAIEEMVEDKYYSLFDLILNSVRQALFSSLNNLDILPLFVESHGRSEFSEKVRIDSTVGWFTSCYPMVLEKIEGVNQSLLNTHQQIKSVPNEGIGYGLIMDEFEYKSPHFLFNFFGIIEEENGIQKVKEFFRFEKHQQNYLSMHPMKIDVMIVDQEVIISIEAQKKYYSKEFLNNLFTLIQQNFSIVSENDVSLNFEIDTEIEYEDLASILEKFN